MELLIRQAVADDAGVLTEIAHEAKRYWGYPERWIALWSDVLTVTPAYIARHPVYVATLDGQPVGFYAVVDEGAGWSLDHLWIAPSHVRGGIGRALFDHMVTHIRAVRPSPLRIESDPNAEPFYLRVGARRVGSVAADVEGTARVLPCLEFDATAT